MMYTIVLYSILAMFLFQFILLVVLSVRKMKRSKNEATINQLYEQLLDPFASYMSGIDQETFITELNRVPDRAVLVERLLNNYVSVMKIGDSSNEVSYLAETYLKELYQSTLKKGNWAKRVNVLHYIEDFHMTSLSSSLLKQLHISKKLDLETKQMIRTLASLHVPEVFDFLVKHPEAPVTLYIDVFRRLDRHLAEEEVKKAFESPFIPFKSAAISFIGSVKLSSYLPNVEQELNSPVTEVRIQSLKTLFRLQYMHNPALLEPFFFSEHWTERMFAARIAGAMTLERFKPVLGHLLGDPVWWVRHAAAEAFTHFGDGELLLAHFSENHEDRYARDMAKQWITFNAGGMS